MIINHSSIIELNRQALANNLQFIRSLIGEKTRISSVIKGNAYGHGIEQMVPELEFLGINHFSVFSSYEAKVAYNYIKNHSSLMIMGDIAAEDVSWVVKNDIDFFVYNTHSFLTLLEEAKTQDKKINIHVELESGMNRHGFSRENWDELVLLLKENQKYIVLKGICTHFAGAESQANHQRILEQQKVFLEGVEKFKKEGLEAENLHTSCSAGVIAYPNFHLDLVRVGVLQYGLWPSKEIQLAYNKIYKTKLQLHSVLSWRSKILDIKKVKAGEFIGYGTSFIAQEDLKVASVPVGYGYGFSRSLSNVGKVLVNGRRVSVVGAVNMNMFLIDVTKTNVNIGDIVTIIGKDGDEAIKVSYFSKPDEHLNYELLTRLDKSIPRIVV